MAKGRLQERGNQGIVLTWLRKVILPRIGVIICGDPFGTPPLCNPTRVKKIVVR